MKVPLKMALHICMEDRRRSTCRFPAACVSKLALISWTSVQPRDSGRHVKENKRSILDGPFVEGLARGFYVQPGTPTETKGGRQGQDRNPYVVLSESCFGELHARSLQEFGLLVNLFPFV